MSNNEIEQIISAVKDQLVKQHEGLAGVQSWQHQENKASLLRLEQRLDDIERKIEPVLEALRTAGNVKRAIIWLSALMLGITGSLFGFKTLLEMIKKII